MQVAMGQNGYTRDEFLHAILHSGQVTKIGQHLALVLYHLADTTTNVAKMSLSDLERITGWAKSTILDHLAEIEMFVRATIGKGRRKTQFELQGVITEAVADLRRVQEANSTPNSTDRVQERNANPNATANSKFSVRETNAVPNSTDRVQEANSTEPDRVRDANSAKESFPPHPPSKKITTTRGEVDNNTARTRGPHMNGVGFIISEEHGLFIPGETVDKWRDRFTAIDLEASMTRLASWMLNKGPLHYSWQQPDAWMVGCLADDNRKALAEQKVTQAKIDQVKSGGKPMRTLPR